MSASPIARQACSHAQAIPSRKVLLTDPSQMPDVYSSTPGGTLYSTTPGGTRIIYERNFLMNLKNSPLGRTPPKDFAMLPPGIAKNSPPMASLLSVSPKQSAAMAKPKKPAAAAPKDDEQFDMDM